MSHKIAFAFPGQGSQSLGMMLGLAEHFPIVRDVFDEASGALGFDLWHLVQEGPADKLNQTEFTQPALLTASYAAWQVYVSEAGKLPEVLAGHSLGEYSALVCAGSIDFKHAVDLVSKRGQFMQEAVPAGEGAMAAIIGMDNDAVKELCEEASQGELVSPANFNSVGQVVIAGQTAAVNRAVEMAKPKGAKLAKVLPVSVPSHCPMMKPAADKLAQVLEGLEISVPDITVINNVDVKAYETVDQIKEGLVRQLTDPVRWVETVEFFVSQGVNAVVECGPGKVLTGLNKRIDKTLELKAYSDPMSLTDVLTLQ